MTAEVSTKEQELLTAATAFADEAVAPNASTWEVERQLPLPVLQTAASLGLAGLMVPEYLGGAELGATGVSRIMEVLAAADLAFAFALVVHNNLAGNIARNGSAEQIDHYIPDMLRADRIGAFLLTEERGGSDAAAIKTRAVRDGERWVLNGEKAWITNCAVADVLSVYAQTDPERGWRGIACFLVDGDTPGIVRETPYALLGGHAMGTGALRFEDCRISGDALFIAPGQAFKVAMQGIDIARIILSAMCCGMLRSGLETALDRTMVRPAFGQRVADFQGVQWMLADVATDLEAGRLLAYEAAAKYDRGEDAAMAAAHAKKFTTRTSLKGLADCMQVMGAAGFRHDQPLARHLAAAKMAQYLDGATEIQNVVIARGLLKARGA